MPEVRTSRSTPGNAAPFNFNGLVRHYFLRRSPRSPTCRSTSLRSTTAHAQSHDFAKRVRPALVADRGAVRGERQGGRDPTGAAGPGHAGGGDLRSDRATARGLAGTVRGLFETTPTASWTSTTRWRRSTSDRARSVDREKAGLKGIPAHGRGGDARRVRAPVVTSPGSTRPPRASPSPCACASPRPTARASPAASPSASTRPRAAGRARGARARRARAGAAAHPAQGPEAGRLRHRRPGGRAGEPGLRDARPEPRSSTPSGCPTGRGSSATTVGAAGPPTAPP